MLYDISQEISRQITLQITCDIKRCYNFAHRYACRYTGFITVIFSWILLMNLIPFYISKNTLTVCEYKLIRVAKYI